MSNVFCAARESRLRDDTNRRTIFRNPIGFCGFLVSNWISGFPRGFQDFWISSRISGFLKWISGWISKMDFWISKMDFWISKVR